MKIVLNPKYILRSLFLFIGFSYWHIFVSRLSDLTSTWTWEHIRAFGGIMTTFKVFIKLFDFNIEKNIPTLYSFLALLFSSILLILITLQNKKNDLKYHAWLPLSMVFFFLSFDEILELHEHLVHLTRRFLNLSGFGTAYWTIPYIIMIAILFFSLYKFLSKLPKRTFKLFVLAGAIFILGSVGMEILGGRQEEINGKSNVLYVFLYTIEELLEMLGVVIFIYALTSYKKITVQID